MTNSLKKFSPFIIGTVAAIGCGESASDDLFTSSGSAGSAGMSGSSGSAGASGSSGQAGTGGKAGSGGKSGSSGAAGKGGSGGKSGSGGTSGTSGTGGMMAGGNAGVGGSPGGSGGDAGGAGTGNAAGTAQAGTGGSAPTCGDGTCNGDENCATCDDDCGVCPPVCGDGTCNGSENCSSCAQDCGACPPTCGDGTCNSNETCSNCSQDCGACPPVCGDGTCNGAEACSTCAQDCGNCPVASCEAGQNGSIDKITASGAIETAYLLHFNPGTEVYSTEVPTIHQFTGAVGPMQMVLLGKEGIQFDLRNSSTNNQIAKTWYKVESFPSPQCDGLALKSQACLAAVAKAFRCQFSPYNESIGCPASVTFSAQPAQAFYSHSQVGWQMLLVHLTCPLEGRLELSMKDVFVRSLIKSLVASRLPRYDQARMAAMDSRNKRMMSGSQYKPRWKSSISGKTTGLFAVSGKGEVLTEVLKYCIQKNVQDVPRHNGLSSNKSGKEERL